MSQDNPPKSILSRATGLVRGDAAPESDSLPLSAEPTASDQKAVRGEPSAPAESSPPAQADSAPAQSAPASSKTESELDAEAASVERDVLEQLRQRKEQAAPSKQFQESLDSILKFCLEPVVAALVKQAARGTTPPFFLIQNPYSIPDVEILSAFAGIAPSDCYTMEIVSNRDASQAFSDLRNIVSSKYVPTESGKAPYQTFLIGCISSSSPSAILRSTVAKECVLPIPPMSYARLQEFAQRFRPHVTLSGTAESIGKWIAWVEPQQLITAQVYDDADWEQGLEQLARLRAGGQQTNGTPRTLDDLFGIDAAENWAKQLFNDLKLVREGEITWNEVDRGALFAGPPGTGKTSLAQAIAYEAGVNFIAVSPVKDWMTGNGLDESIKQMAASFNLARQQAPSILFIDEIDSIGNREKFTGHNASWSTSFLNAVLTELDGFEGRDQIVVIGATNYPDNVDPALRRSGRLDRLIYLQRPDADALAAMYQHMLAKYPNDLLADAEALRECARTSLGLTGADVEVIVRGARRRARRDGNRPIGKTDVLEEIYGIPPDAERRPLSGEALRNTACHEAGHALVGLILPTLRDQIGIASVIPDSQGALGFVSIVSDGYTNATRESLQDRICMALAGRAAEELVYPPEKVTTGAGGSSASSDLAVARRLAEAYVGIYGFSRQHPNWWADSDVDEEARAVVVEQYARAVGLLQKRETLLRQLAAELEKRFVLDKNELRKLVPEVVG